MNVMKKRNKKWLKNNENIVTLIQFEKWEKLMKRLEKQMQMDMTELSMKGTDEMLPIHWACKHGPRLPKKILVSLLNANPHSVKAQDNEGSTPLHYTIFYGFANLDMIRILLSRYPGAALVRDKYGRTPIFHAVAHKIGVKLEALKLLLSVEGAAEGLTLPCGPIPGQFESPATSRGQPIENINSRFQRIWKYPEVMRTPLYMMWDTAMSAHSSSRWFLKRSSDSPKLSGKRMAKALFLLECAYLHQMNKPIDIYQWKRKKMVKKLLNYSQDSLAQVMRDQTEELGASTSKHKPLKRDSLSLSRSQSSWRLMQKRRSMISRQTFRYPPGCIPNPRNRSKSDQASSILHTLQVESNLHPSLRNFTQSDQVRVIEDGSNASLSSTSKLSRFLNRIRNNKGLDRIPQDGSLSHQSNSRSERLYHQRNETPPCVKLSPRLRCRKFSVAGNIYDDCNPAMEENSLDEAADTSHKSFHSLNELLLQNILAQENDTILSDGRGLESSRTLRQKIIRRLKDQNVFPIIHACLRLRKFMPEEMLDFALENYPEQLNMMEDGSRPIHLAIELGSDSFDVQKLLASEQDAAAAKNLNGKLPLHLALLRSVVDHDTVRGLVEAFPLACLEIDDQTGLYPFMLAAVNSEGVSPQSNLSLIYEILIMYPECAAYNQ
jgi:ankyrin repeat protein